ncbi:thymus-specific serine protease-like [Trichechus manatus latirostris]|uniref:Thymus-specific serine protease-like n=1 Tax=Trichechus manatus latirostris TaxID=127582 RepID=A0A2Y9QY15_TRIMA|nr:thymus-specific serine protease-like [Trichechus manatus latirostris]
MGSVFNPWKWKDIFLAYLLTNCSLYEVKEIERSLQSAFEGHDKANLMSSWTWYKYSTCFQNIHFYFIVKLMLSSIFSTLIIATNSVNLSFNYRDLSTASLRYLSSRQALADIANFRTEIARKLGLTENKWVAYGGSYGGSLAVWSRIKHPNLFAAAVGSSAPIQAKLNFYEYKEVIGRILSAHNSECPKAVKEAFAILVQMLKRPKYYSKLEKDFMLCEPIKINSPKDTAFLMVNMICIVHSFVRKQINKIIKGEQDELNIDNLCDNMTDTSLGSPYDRFTKIVHLFLKSKHMDCLSANYNDELEQLSNPSLDYLHIKYDRQWFYQCCTEFGFFETTDSKNQPFSGTPLRYFFQLCSDVFGPEFSRDLVAQGVKTTNKYYGGFNVNGSKIIFSNGSNDPWHRLGITKDISEDLPAVFIKGNTVLNSQRHTNRMKYIYRASDVYCHKRNYKVGSKEYGEGHCADVSEQDDTDSAELIEAREKIFQILQKWLKQ